jgi:hypothetical protein
VAKSAPGFTETFAVLRGILKAHEGELIVQADTPHEYQLASPTMKDRIGRPLFVAAVQIKKNYVSYHLMPVYAVAEVARKIPPDLKKRMQGKSCFNFTTVDPLQIEELKALTREGIARFKDLRLPWESHGGKRPTGAGRARPRL